MFQPLKSEIGTEGWDDIMIQTVENFRKIISGRVGLLLLGTGLYMSVPGMAIIGVVITTLFGIDIVLTMREESA